MVDLNYMMYTSMNGDTRQENIADLLDAYYDNYARILASDNKHMNFTLPMLKKEFSVRNLYGLLTASAVIPIVLIESEDVPDIAELIEEEKNDAMAEHKEKTMNLVQKNPLLTSRFLSMFDEMRQTGLFHNVLSE